MKNIHPSLLIIILSIFIFLFGFILSIVNWTIKFINYDKNKVEIKQINIPSEKNLLLKNHGNYIIFFEYQGTKNNMISLENTKLTDLNIQIKSIDNNKIIELEPVRTKFYIFTPTDYYYNGSYVIEKYNFKINKTGFYKLLVNYSIKKKYQKLFLTIRQDPLNFIFINIIIMFLIITISTLLSGMIILINYLYRKRKYQKKLCI